MFFIKYDSGKSVIVVVVLLLLLNISRMDSVERLSSYACNFIMRVCTIIIIVLIHPSRCLREKYKEDYRPLIFLLQFYGKIKIDLYNIYIYCK